MGFEAKYSGRCAECGGGISVGDLIQFGEFAGDVVHAVCPAGHLDLKPSDVVCPVCFLVKPCGCDD